MANNEFTSPIPARLKNVAKGGHVAGADQIIDDALGKEQSVINQEVSEEIAEIKGGSAESIATLNQKIATEQGRAQGAEQGLDNRLSTVEELAEISVGGGDIGVGTTADFESDNPSDLAKVPTVGAMLGGANDGVYDISARHNMTKYADLAAALGTNGANVPVGVRKGGMSIKFIQSSSHKYVQARCMAQNFTTDVTQWQGVDDEPTAGSDNLVKSGGIYSHLTIPLSAITEQENSRNIFTTEWSDAGYKLNYDTGVEETGGSYRRTGFIAVEPSTQYTASCVLIDAPNVYIFCYGQDKTTFLGVIETSYGFYPKTFTTKANTQFIRIEHSSGAMPTNYQIELGSVATEYVTPGIIYKVPVSAITGLETMQNAIAQNSLNIQTNSEDIAHNKDVLDDISILLESKNIFISEWSESGYAIDLDNGEEKTATNYRRTGFINVLPETEYTASCVLQDAPNVYVFCYDENKSYIGYVTAVYGFYPHSFTTLAGTYYIRIEHTSGAKPINYQIEVGNVATEYVPPIIRYKVPMTSIEGIDDITILKIGKNRFDSEWSEPGKNINYDTGLDQDGTTQRRTGFVAIKSETTYTLSCVLVDAPSVIVFYYDENKQHLSTETTVYGFYPKTITTPANCKFIRVTHGSGGMPTNYQVEEGSEATTYEPYQPDSYKVPVSAIDGLPDNVLGINDKKWLFLGDSITGMTGNTSWVNKFKELVYANEQSFNQAVGGAKWCDDEPGIEYNGKPYESQNYIGNQVAWVQRAGITAVDLDAIIIAAGTNDDNVTFPSDSDIESAFYASGSSTLIALENVDRSTWQGAIRWTVQTLRGLFPNAKIFLATPLQRMSVDQGQSRGDMYPVIRQKRETIIKMAKRMSVYLIDTSECNISDMQSGMYADGLHLSVAGSTVMSKFVYNSIKKWF